MRRHAKTSSTVIIAILGGACLSACVSNPTVPAPSSTSLPSPSGPPQANSRPVGADAARPQTTTTAPQKSPQQEQRSSKAKQQARQASKPAPGEAAGKTDDEILADALKALEGRPQRHGNSGIEQQASDKQPRQRHNNAGEGKDSSQNAATTAETQPTGAPGRARTAAEQARQLDRELNEEFAKFDRLMLTERETVRNEANREGGGRSLDTGGGSGLFGDEEGDLEALRTANAAPPAPARNNSQRRGDNNIDADVQSESNVPDDLASAEGDDVIARQLREAAMKEPDPALREKLWDEYRKYKKSL